MDLVTLSLSVLLQQLPWLLLWLLLAFVCVVGESLAGPFLEARQRRILHGVCLGVAGATGLWLAFDTLWLCDDAYISFRYARNFADGNGLVFNPGEWVEGYTNFLWTFLLGIAAWAGADIPLWGLFGNLAAFCAALFFVAAAVRRAAPSPLLFPFAAIALAASRPFYTFASSGLETMPAAMCVAAAIWASTLRRGALLSGIALTLAALTRPDHVLIYGCMGLALVGEDLLHRRDRPLLRRLDFRRIAAYAAPFLLLYVPYFLWRWQAYGDLFPNTYYAKSGGETYYSQGLVYLGHFFWTSGAWAVLPVLGVALLGRPLDRNETRLRLFAALSLPLFIHYVAKVGGDFMEHRFFVSLLPIAAVALEVGLRWKASNFHSLRRAVGYALVGALAISAAVVPVRILKPWEKRWHLADEPSFYRVKSIFPLEIGSGYMNRGLALRKAFTDRGITPPIAGDSIGLLGYYSGLPIVDAFGLVNRRFAHKPIEKRGRPGHEKFATIQELIEEGAIIETRGNPWGRFGHLAEGRVDGITFHFLRWDPAWVAAVAEIPGARLPDPEAGMRALLKGASRRERLEARAFYQRFLGKDPDEAAGLEWAPSAARVREALQGASGRAAVEALRLAEEVLPADDPDLLAVSRGFARRWTFEGPSNELVLEGQAFGAGPVSGPIGRQSAIGGFQGGSFLNSMHGGDGARGRVILPSFVIPDEPIHLLVGGGRDCRKVFVGLEVEGTIVARACGRNDEILRPATLHSKKHVGQEGRVVVVDEGTGGWGHILVDDVVVPGGMLGGLVSP